MQSNVQKENASGSKDFSNAIDPKEKSISDTLSKNDIVKAFINKMQSAGIVPTEPINGHLGTKLIWFHCLGDDPHSKNGYAILLASDWSAGVFGNTVTNSRNWWSPCGYRAPVGVREMFLNELRKLEPGRAETLPQIAGQPSSIYASPFSWLDPACIPRREWLYGEHYIRRYLSATLATGGVGKSSLTVVEALAMVSGKPLLGTAPKERLRVWIWNGEDPMDEIQRKVMAAALHYGLSADDLSGLFVDSGRETRLQIAKSSRDGVEIATPLVNSVIQTLIENRIDVLSVDPFVTTHTVNENDNAAIQAVVRQFAYIAEEANCAIDLSHHTRKTGGNEATVEDGRGASALLAAVRSARILNPMTAKECDLFGVDNRRRFFRVDNGKANLALPPDKTDWRQMQSVELGNGDNVGVVTVWKPPDPFEEISRSDLFNAQTEVAKGGPWRRDQQSPAWVGHPIALALGWDLEQRGYKRRLEAILKVWITNGAFEEYTDTDPRKREQKQFVRIGRLAL
jgi:hypothetical protein